MRRLLTNKRFLTIVSLLIILAVIVLGSLPGSPLNVVLKPIGAIVNPIQKAVKYTGNSITSFWVALTDGMAIRNENEQLRAEIAELQAAVKKVMIAENVLGYIHNIVDATRSEKRFVIGASPRAMLALIRASQANAFMSGRDFVRPDDVKQMYVPVLLHRLMLSVEAKMSQEDPETVLRGLVSKVEVPVK